MLSLDEKLEAEEFCTVLEQIQSEVFTSADFQEKHIKKLIKGLHSCNELDIVTDILAILAKVEDQRTVIVDCGAVEHLVKIVDNSVGTKAAVNSLRVIANVCFNDDKNREIVLCSGGLDCVLKFIKNVISNDNLEPIFPTVAAGVLCNLCAENELLAKAFIEKNGLEYALRIATHPHANLDMYLMCLKALKDHEFMLAEFGKENCLKVIFDNLSIENNDELFREHVQILDSIAHDDKISDTIYRDIGFQTLLHFSESAKSKKTISTIYKLIASILGADECKEETFMEENKKMIELFVSWCDNEDSEIRCAGALALGNIARSDKNSEKLVKMDVVPRLLKLVSSEDAREQHAALGILKNISILEKNRSYIVKAGFLKAVDLHLIDSMHSAIHFQVASIIKSLCADNVENCQAVLGEENILNLLKKLANHDEEGIKFETIRCYCWLLKLCPCKAVIKLEGIQGIQKVVNMLNCKFDILMNDSILALHVLLKSSPENMELICNCDNLEKNLLQIIEECSSDEIKSNAVVFLAELMACDVFLTACNIEECKSTVEKHSSSKNESLQTASKTLLKIISEKMK